MRLYTFYVARDKLKQWVKGFKLQCTKDDISQDEAVALLIEGYAKGKFKLMPPKEN